MAADTIKCGTYGAVQPLMNKRELRALEDSHEAEHGEGTVFETTGFRDDLPTDASIAGPLAGPCGSRSVVPVMRRASVEGRPGRGPANQAAVRARGDTKPRLSR
jgi:hypothetical protein